VPVGAVTAIYARETGSGMGFEVEQATSASVDDEDGQGKVDAAPQEPASSDQTSKRPSLKIVKWNSGLIRSGRSVW